jgi:hypothetical protein
MFIQQKIKIMKTGDGEDKGSKEECVCPQNVAQLSKICICANVTIRNTKLLTFIFSFGFRNITT